MILLLLLPLHLLNTGAGLQIDPNTVVSAEGPGGERRNSRVPRDDRTAEVQTEDRVFLVRQGRS